MCVACPGVAYAPTFTVDLFSIFIYTYFKGVTYKSIDNKLNNELESIAIQLTRQSMVYPVTKYPSNMIYIYKRDRVMYYTPQNGYFSDVFCEPYRFACWFCTNISVCIFVL